MPRAIASPREKLITLFEELPTAEALLVYEVLGVLLKRRTAEKAGRMVKMRVAPTVAAAAPAAPVPAQTAQTFAAGAAGAPPKAKRVRPSRAKAKPGSTATPAAAAALPAVPTYGEFAAAETSAQGDGDPGLAPDSYDDGTPEPIGQ